MSVAIDKFNYKCIFFSAIHFEVHYAFRLPYKTIFGGAGALTKQQMYAVNGWSNSYFGWGGEGKKKMSFIFNISYALFVFR